MDFAQLLNWVDANKAWLFSGAGVAVLTAIAGLVWRRHSTVQAGRDVHYQVGPQVDVNDLVKTLLEAQPRQQDVARERIEELIRGQEETQQQVRELTDAVRTLAERQNEPDAPPGIEAALRELARGETSTAEAIFEQVLERKKAEGEGAYKEAAAAARHIGALAFLHDTQKALSAYTQAVELDPENPHSWNRLGHLRDRVGDLDGAIAAYERVLRLGNVAEDRGVIAAAYGNLGIVYKTRGDLVKAEEYYLKSLALNEELGRKEGIASQYGNLGIVFRRRGDLVKAEEYHLNAMAIDKELGRKEGIANQHSGLGLVYQKRGELDQAEEHHLKSLALNEELGRKWSIASDYGNLGVVYKARGNVANACKAWTKSRRLFEELGAAPEVAEVQALMDEAGCGREETQTKSEED